MPIRVAISRRTLLAAGGAAVLGACAGAKRQSAARAAPDSSPSTRTSAPSTTAPATLPPFVQSGPRDRAAVAFTFHGSGDIGLVDELLQAAARLHAPITVFAVGQWLDANPSIGRRIVDAGHELANHTYTHPVLTRLGPAAALDEINRCRDALDRHGGSRSRWFRPSGTPTPTATITDAARLAGYPTIVGYDIDPHDYQDPGAGPVASRVAVGLQPGAIVSLHTGHAGTVAAFEPMISAARERGLQPVTVSALLGLPA